MTGSELKRRNWDNLSLEHNLCFQLPAVESFPVKRGATTTAERIPNQSRPQRGPRSGCKNITASGIFGLQTTLRAFYNLMGKRMDINDKKSVSFKSLPEFQIWTKMPSSGLNRSPQNDEHLYSVKALEFNF